MGVDEVGEVGVEGGGGLDVLETLVVGFGGQVGIVFFFKEKAKVEITLIVGGILVDAGLVEG